LTRTTKDIFIEGISVKEAKEPITKWFKQNKIKIIVNDPDYIYGRLGLGIFNGYKYFRVTFDPAQNGVIAKTEGWVEYIPPEIFGTGPYTVVCFWPETEFTEHGKRPIGRSQKQGMKVIKRLWIFLESLPK